MKNEKLKNLVKYLRKNVFIVGVENVRIENIDFLFSKLKEKIGDVSFQLFDADKIAGKIHVEFAVLNALKAFKDGRNISRSLPIEVLIYVSAQRQIGKAFQMVGLTSKTKNMVVVVFSNIEQSSKILDEILSLTGGKINNKVLEINREKVEIIKKVFGISNLEIKTQMFAGLGLEEIVKKLVVERVALLATQQ
ncbi:hypothetical protein CW703_05075 [Candidatus Bathyarchaeota archaeon]|nr:MAG: hypothetical protein CW703_05075 [Candidatus Bathyarchaeota archaeon]